MQDRMGIMILVLGTIAAAFGGGLAFVNAHTRQVMDERTFNETILPTLSSTFAPYGPTNRFLEDRVRHRIGEDAMGRELFAEVCMAKKNDDIVALATVVTGRGYAGEFTVLVAADAGTEEIIAIKTLAQKETRNLGDRIARDDDPFVTQFIGKRFGSNFRLKSEGGEVDAMSGATVTSAGFSRAVKTAGKLLQSQLKKGEQR